MKQYAYKRRHTAVMKIKVGDTVLCKQERKNSLKPLYDPDPMVVIGVKGSMIYNLDPQFQYELFHIYFTSLHSSRDT